ncbi:MAG: hypothetical protein AAF699_17465 [Pseudomonadota bacterium]
MIDRLPSYGFLILLAFVALIALFATYHGAGVSPDSVSYLRSTNAMLNGASLLELGTHFPPGVALLWHLSAQLGLEPLVAARAISIFSLLVCFVALRSLMLAAGCANWIVLCALCTLAVSVNWVSNFWMAWSEPPFLALFFLSLNLALQIAGREEGVDTRWQWSLLLLSLAAMLLLRYAAAPLAAAILLFLFLRRWIWSPERLVQYFFAGLLVLAPLLCWLGFSMILAEQSSAREFAFHPPGLQHLNSLALTLTQWGGGLSPLLVAMLTLLLLIWPLCSSHYREKPLVQLVCYCTFCYAGFLIFSITFMDAHTPLDGRILAPILPLLLCQIVVLGSDRHPALSAVPLATLFVFSLPALAGELSQSMVHGRGFNSPVYAELEILREVDKLPPGTPIYSNVYELFYVHLNREAELIPRNYDPRTQRPNALIAEQWSLVLADMRERGAILVWSPIGAYRRYLPTVADMLAFGDLEIDRELEGGVFLRPRQAVDAPD